MGKYDALYEEAPKSSKYGALYEDPQTGKYSADLEPPKPAPGSLKPIPAEEIIRLLGAEKTIQTPQQKLQAAGDKFAPGEPTPGAKTVKAAFQLPLAAAQFAGQTIDRVTGAPTRSAVHAMQLDPGNPEAAGIAFAKQFGRDPNLAPTGKEIAAKAGIENPTAQNIVGFLADAGLDFTNVLPVGAVAKAAYRGVKGGVKAAAKPIVGTLMKAEEAGQGTQSLRQLVGGLSEVREQAAGRLSPLSVNIKVADDLPEMKRIAAEIGIPENELSDAIKFGTGSVPNRREKFIRGGNSGQESIDRFRAQLGVTEKSVSKELEKQAGKAGLKEPKQAGEFIRQSVENGLDRLNSKVTTTHESIVKDFPGLKVSGPQAQIIESALTGMEREAKALMRRAPLAEQRASGQALLGTVDAVRNTNGSYKQINELRDFLGKAIFKDAGKLQTLDSDVAKLRDLYFSLNEALLGTVDKLDNIRAGQFKPAGVTSYASLGEQLRTSNQILSEAMTDKGVLTQAIGNKTKAGENIFGSALSDSRKVEAIRNLTTPEEFNSIRASYINSLIKRNKDGNILFGSTAKALENTNEQAVLKSMFSPNEIQGIKDRLNFGIRLGDEQLPGSSGAVQMALGSGSVPTTIPDVVKAAFTPLQDYRIGAAKAKALNPVETPSMVSQIAKRPLRKANIIRTLGPTLASDEEIQTSRMEAIKRLLADSRAGQ